MDIKPYFETGLGKLYHGDCLEVMKEMDDNSIDLVLTDPPYGYSFMGKNWDKAVISVGIWKECLRILKPGAFAFIMSAPRQDVLSRMIVNLQDAGFMIGFTSLYWNYATGFPKAGNVSKFVDKRLGAEREVIGIYKTPNGRDYTKENSGKNGYNDTELSMGRNVGKERRKLTAPSTPQAKALEGSYLGYQPKPAVEVILVVMKPLSEKSYIDQAMKDGKGTTWLDDCRIPYIDVTKEPGYRPNRKNHNLTGAKTKEIYGKYATNSIVKDYGLHDSHGRFPANLLVSDDVLNDGKISNNYRPNHIGKATGSQNFAGRRGVHNEPNDSGSFSRYFDLDRWWIERIKELPKSIQKTFPFLIVPKASKGEKNKGCKEKSELTLRSSGIAYNEHSGIHQNRKKGNNHPTVKPLKLFSYLITLGSRPGDIVFDPFIGSGTVGVACEWMKVVHEQKYRQWIGIEREEKYCQIAVERIKREYSDKAFRWELFDE